MTHATPRAPLELWAGFECTLNRVGDSQHDQLALTGHYGRLDDLDRLAELGVRTVRYPILWERVERLRDSGAPFAWPDAAMARLRALGIEPIVGLVHHGSGPFGTSLLDDRFADGLAAFARTVAERYPWVTRYTPVNEPLTTARFSALYGVWYPHAHDDAAFLRATLNQVRATRPAGADRHQPLRHERAIPRRAARALPAAHARWKPPAPLRRRRSGTRAYGGRGRSARAAARGVAALRTAHRRDRSTSRVHARATAPLARRGVGRRARRARGGRRRACRDRMGGARRAGLVVARHPARGALRARAVRRARAATAPDGAGAHGAVARDDGRARPCGARRTRLVALRRSRALPGARRAAGAARDPRVAERPPHPHCGGVGNARQRVRAAVSRARVGASRADASRARRHRPWRRGARRAPKRRVGGGQRGGLRPRRRCRTRRRILPPAQRGRRRIGGARVRGGRDSMRRLLVGPRVRRRQERALCGVGPCRAARRVRPEQGRLRGTRAGRTSGRTRRAHRGVLRSMGRMELPHAHARVTHAGRARGCGGRSRRLADVRARSRACDARSADRWGAWRVAPGEHGRDQLGRARARRRARCGPRRDARPRAAARRARIRGAPPARRRARERAGVRHAVARSVARRLSARAPLATYAARRRPGDVGPGRGAGLTPKAWSTWSRSIHPHETRRPPLAAISRAS